MIASPGEKPCSINAATSSNSAALRTTVPSSPGIEQMDFPQVDSAVPEQGDGMGRHQHLSSRLAIHPRHETGKA